MPIAIGFTELFALGTANDLVFTPNFNVGDAWPLVRPYTALLNNMYGMSTFFLPTPTKCPAPMPSPSPSPPTAIISNSDLPVLRLVQMVILCRVKYELHMC